MKRYYLCYDRVYYGVVTILGEKTILITSKQSEASITYEIDLEDVIHHLSKNKVPATPIEINSDHISGNGRRRGVII